MHRTLKQVRRIKQSKAEIKRKWSGEKGANRSYSDKWSLVETDLVEKLQENCPHMVCEIGCGTGRIAKFLNPAKYVGVDINKTAIQKSRKSLPDHMFKTIKWEDKYPPADTYLFFTVLLHIPDDELDEIIKKLRCQVVVVEAMGRWIRDYGKGNNYLRDPGDYRKAFQNHGFREKKLLHFSSKAYPFYVNMQVFYKNDIYHGLRTVRD